MASLDLCSHIFQNIFPGSQQLTYATRSMLVRISLSLDRLSRSGCRFFPARAFTAEDNHHSQHASSKLCLGAQCAFLQVSHHLTATVTLPYLVPVLSSSNIGSPSFSTEQAQWRPPPHGPARLSRQATPPSRQSKNESSTSSRTCHSPPIKSLISAL